MYAVWCGKDTELKSRILFLISKETKTHKNKGKHIDSIKKCQMNGPDSCIAFVVPSEWALFIKLATTHPWPETLNFVQVLGRPILTISIHFKPSVQSLSHVQLFATSWAAARQASLSITNCRSLLKLMPIELVMPSNHLILCWLLLLPWIFPSIRSFSNESALRIRCHRIGVSASASVLLVNIQGWFPLGLTGLLSLQFKGLPFMLSLSEYFSCLFFPPLFASSLWSWFSALIKF